MTFEQSDSNRESSNEFPGFTTATRFLDEIKKEIPQSLKDRIAQGEGAAGDLVKQKVQQSLPAEVSALATLASFLPDGEIKTGALISKAQMFLGDRFDSKTVEFLKGFDSVSKHGDHIEFNRSSDMEFPIDKDVPGTAGLVSVDSVKLSNLSFDLKKDGDGTHLKNINGLSIEFSAAGQDLSSDVQDLTVKKGEDGKPLVITHLGNPSPGLVNAFLDQPDKIPVEITFDDKGGMKVINKEEIKDAIKGDNPFVRPYLDVGDDLVGFVKSPSPGGAFNLAKDGVIAAGSTVILGPIGFVASPVIGDAVGAVGDAITFWD